MAAMNPKHSEAAPSGDVSPYLERPIRTLSQAKHDQESALLDLVTQDSRIKPKS
jgi:hypothetical protein